MPSLASMPDAKKVTIKNKGSFEDWNYISYRRSNKEGNVNEQKVRRLPAEILRTKGLSLLCSSNKLETNTKNIS